MRNKYEQSISGIGGRHLGFVNCNQSAQVYNNNALTSMYIQQQTGWGVEGPIIFKVGSVSFQIWHNIRALYMLYTTKLQICPWLLPLNLWVLLMLYNVPWGKEHIFPYMIYDTSMLSF